MDELYIFDGNTVKCYSPPILFFLFTLTKPRSTYFLNDFKVKSLMFPPYYSLSFIEVLHFQERHFHILF